MTRPGGAAEDPSGEPEEEAIPEPALRRLAAAYRARFSEVLPRRRHLRADFLAGIPGAISSVPDAMASSILAGVAPTHGLYASVAGPIAGGLSTSTRLMLISTTSASALAAGSALQGSTGDQRSDAMLWLTLVAGAAMVVAGLAGLSRYVRFVSHSVMLGFLTGVAVNMVLGQLPDLLGVDAHGSVALTKALDTLLHLGRIEPTSAVTGLLALLIIALLGSTRFAVLGSLLALAVPTGLVLALDWSKVARVSDGGAIPTGLPLPAIPELSALSLSVASGGLAVAVIVLVQGAGVAEAVPNADGTPSRAGQDFTAQGIANLASGAFAGQPVGGSVGQTALNVTSGARSRWGGIWSGLWVLAILLLFAPVVSRVALPTLAALLVYAGWSTIRPGEILTILHAGRIPAIALLATFVAVLVLPVATAVGVGVAASLLLQLNQEAIDLRVVRLVPDGPRQFREEPVPRSLVGQRDVLLDAYGSMFFAGARTLQQQLPDPAGADAPTVVLRIRGRTTLGATFLTVIGDYAHRLEAVGGSLYLSGVDPALLRRWDNDQVTEKLAGVRIFPATPEVGEASTAALADATTHRVRSTEEQS